MGYLLENAIAFDRQVNALLWGKSSETLSSRAYRSGVKAKSPKKRWRIARIFIDGLFFWQNQHCLSSYRAGLDRRKAYLKRYEEGKK